ncbi:speckle-type POZ protein-like [Cotesia glomerata]|uniref:speckle-type POZ protein-like n=1 Tax=Cotesia glomerata TaxID=32391 RepID=UPI001D015C0C|nr:speckle-type POZ protein-like [Cotesia glomerata]
MSIEEIKTTGYVKFVWPANLFTLSGTIYSDDFEIKNLENVTFNIGVKFVPESTRTLTLWVKKSSSEPASALIKMMVGNVRSQIDIDNWKRSCYISESTNISGQTLTRTLRENSYCNPHYFYEITIACEIFWKSKIKRTLDNSLYHEVQKFYKSVELSDVTIIVDKVKIPAHKLVLAAHSEVFAKMLQSEMKEAKDGEINIKGFDPEIILEMLHYCYKGKTKASKDTKAALQMLEVADIYQIIKLKDICESTLINNMSTDNVLDIIDAADDHTAIDLRKSAINLIVLHSKTVVASSNFKQLCYKKPDLMFELTCAFGNK